MSTIVTRSGKGSPLTHVEVDANFTNLNTDKYQEGSAIGAVTPAAGTFTTLTATGQTSLGGAAGSEGLRVTTVASSNIWLQASGGVSGSTRTKFGQEGSGSAAGFDIYARNGAAISFSTNGAATAEQFRVANTASAVNYVQVTGAATSSGPIISAQGSDASVDLLFSAKGTAGSHVFRTNTTVRQFQVNHVTSAVNYGVVTGSIAGNAVPFTVAGSDTNISQVFQSKGTGAIDLAAGSSGVNISNGGTVTAITGTAAGSGYTSIPSVAITAPTTAGGVQATATAAMFQNVTALNGGGSGYSVNDVLSYTGGTFSAAITVTVTSVSAGVITGFTVGNSGTYTVLPTNPISVTGGTGTGATFNVTAWSVRTNNFTITNAGSGYVEQPTVSFSGGGGSGATAFATIGSTVTFKSLNDITVQLPSGPAMSIVDSGNPGTGGYLQFTNSSTSNAIQRAIGSNTNVGIYWLTKGTGGHSFNTNNSSTTQQMVISHTASAVNYVQVTGAATGSSVQITTQGSDNNIGTIYGNKGVGSHSFRTQGTTSIQFQITNTTNAVNRLEVTGGVAGSAPILSAQGTDTNIDLTLTPRGTGNVRFGTYTASMALTVQGYIEIKDSGGTVRKLAVIA